MSLSKRRRIGTASSDVHKSAGSVRTSGLSASIVSAPPTSTSLSHGSNMLAAQASTTGLTDDVIDMDIADMLDNGPAETKPRRSLLDLPPEIIDRILAKDFEIIDHFCLSWTCQLLNRAYTKAIWSALAPPHASKIYGRKKALNRGKKMLNRIASNYLSGRSDASLVRVHPEMKSGQIRKIEAIDRLPVNEIKGVLLREISITQLTKKEAMEKYLVTARELARLPKVIGEKWNLFGGPQNASAYYDVSVRALAFRLHGGPEGHRQLVAKKRADEAEVHD